jgi:hypothetical protein
MSAFHDAVVNRLPLPPLLVELMRTGRWQHPGDEAIKRAVPFFDAEVDLLSIDEMRRESRGKLADSPKLSTFFREVRHHAAPEPNELPWRDVDRSVLIAVNRIAGEDIAIALDYRTNMEDPRVIATDWTQRGGCFWREVAPTFTRFATLLGLKG